MSLREAVLRRVAPFCFWLPGAFRVQTARLDLAAGAASAALTLPQSIVFANLAGVPPQYGLYTAIFATLVAALWGSSRHLLTGPNTAMSLMLGSALAPFAGADSHEYLALIAVVSLAVGLTQILIALLRASRFLTYIPLVALDAFMAAVGFQILLSQIPYASGITPVAGEPVWKGAVSALLAWRDFRPYSVLVFAVTVAAGIGLRQMRVRGIHRFALPGALGAGLLCNEILVWVLSRARTGVLVAGHVAVHLWPFALPHPLNPEYRALLPQLLPDIFAIALIGLVQSLLVSRAAAEESGQPVDPDQDAFAQGLANLAVSSLSGFAAGGSVNRSMAHQDAGALTPMAAVYSALIVFLAAWAIPGVIAAIPVPAMAGMLCLVAAALIHPVEARELARQSWGQASLYLLVLFCGIFVGLTVAVVAGFALPTLYYLVRSAQPLLRVEESGDGEGVTASLGGSVFFASVPAIARELRALGEARRWSGRVTIHLRGIHYLDHDGRTLLAREIARWREGGGQVNIDAEAPILEALNSATNAA